MHVSTSVDIVGPGRSAHIDVRAARRALLRVVHGSVHTNFSDGFRSRRRNGFADGEINRRAALNRYSAEGRGGAAARVIHNAGGSHLARALTIEEAKGIDPVQQVGVAGVTLAVGPDRGVTQTRIRSGPGGEFRA